LRRNPIHLAIGPISKKDIQHGSAREANQIAIPHDFGKLFAGFFSAETSVFAGICCSGPLFILKLALVVWAALGFGTLLAFTCFRKDEWTADHWVEAHES
jgi:hypothetical protein